MIVGRREELSKLLTLKETKKANLIVLRGRRRIGKSTLLEEFGRRHKKFVEIVGLAPSENIDNNSQLQNFSEQLSLVEKIPGLKFENWTQAFDALSKFNEKGEVFILLDEISWMAANDEDFLGKLKIAWDTKLKKNSKLTLALCGSVSSWIEKNILKDTDFVGRISFEYQLRAFSIEESFEFLKSYKVSDSEKLKLLMITGGIPKYLEEINYKLTVEENIKRLCYEQTGYLYNDFRKIFNDIFGSRAKIYQQIVENLANEKLQIKELSEKMNVGQNGDLTEYVTEMEQADFIARNYTWDFKGKTSKLSKLRIKDNYLNFYLKFVLPHEANVKKNLYKDVPLAQIMKWDTIRGYQFENLVLENYEFLIKKIGINRSEILQYGPYFQTKTKRREGCQIDLMFLCKNNYIYICEVKFKEKLGIEIVAEVEKKVAKLNLPKNFSIRPVLIYNGHLSSELEKSNYFIHKVTMLPEKLN